MQHQFQWVTQDTENGEIMGLLQIRTASVKQSQLMPKRQTRCATDDKGRGRAAHILCSPKTMGESQALSYQI